MGEEHLPSRFVADLGPEDEALLTNLLADAGEAGGGDEAHGSEAGPGEEPGRA